MVSSILRPHQGVLAAQTGHINVHETGAVEATGHKVLPIRIEDGKITAEDVQKAYNAHWSATHEHMMQSGMVYISHPTEVGTLYTKAELTALNAVCQELGLPLFLDGARLGYGLGATNSDVTLTDVAALTDVFYIGGTKGRGARWGGGCNHCACAPKGFSLLHQAKGCHASQGAALGAAISSAHTRWAV